MNWTERFVKKQRIKSHIKQFLVDFQDSVIIKQWECNSFGNVIYKNLKPCNDFRLYDNYKSDNDYEFYGYSSGLKDGDVIVMRIPNQSKMYEIGFFVNVNVQMNPPDMFLASYIRLGVADNWSRETIKKLALAQIK